MQQVVYPALINYDDPTGLYYLAMYDVGIFVEGDSVEVVYKKASDLLKTFSEVSLEVNGFLPVPTAFDKFKDEHKGTEAILVQTNLEDTFVSKYVADLSKMYMQIDPFGE